MRIWIRARSAHLGEVSALGWASDSSIFEEKKIGAMA